MLQSLKRCRSFAWIPLALLLPGAGGAVEVVNFAVVGTGPCSSAGACGGSGLVMNADASTSASFTSGGFSVSANAMTGVETDGLELHSEFSLAGNFDPVRNWYRAEITSQYDTPLQLFAVGPVNLNGPGTIRLVFEVHGVMSITGNPVVPPPVGSRVSIFQSFNQLRARTEGNEFSFVFREDLTSTGTKTVGTMAISAPLPVDLSNPGTLSVLWQGGADVDFMSGNIALTSMFGSTATLRAVEVRDAQGNLLDVDVQDDLGHSLVVPAPVPLPAAAWLTAPAVLALLRRARRIR